MVDKELIEIWKKTLRPAISSWLLKTNYEGLGEQDKEEFERDFGEILDLALIGLNASGESKPMSDLIERQVAIDAYGDWYVEEGTADGFIGTVKQLLEGLPPVQPERKWIPVSERLPELDEDGYSQKVLACYGNYSGCDILEYRATEGIGKWYIGDMDESPEDIGLMVLAWMPLPEKYKGEQGEK